MSIAFLHTSKVNVQRFEKLIQSIDKGITAEHYVNETLLHDALSGNANEELFNAEIREIQKTNPALIICTCSSYGHFCKLEENVYGIDKPVAKHLVENFEKILVVFAAESTKAITLDLLKQLAVDANTSVELILCDCTSSWKYFENGEYKLYQKDIASKILPFKNQVDVIFLAQASMDGAQQYLAKGKPAVYTSPEIGLKAILKQIK